MMDRAGKKIAEFEDEPPVLTREDKNWVVFKRYSYQDGETVITIPQGFQFDLASVPRLFWNIIAPFDLSLSAPLVHDFLYRTQGDPNTKFTYATLPRRSYTRKEVDQLFKIIMEEEAVAKWRFIVAYYGVRWFGGFAWRGNKKKS